jgi:hypothetical protein
MAGAGLPDTDVELGSNATSPESFGVDGVMVFAAMSTDGEPAAVAPEGRPPEVAAPRHPPTRR